MRFRSSLLFFLIVIYSCSNIAAAHEIRVKLFSEVRENQFILQVEAGEYEVRVNDNYYSTLKQGDRIVTLLYNNRVIVKARNLDGISADSVVLKSGGDDSSFRLTGSTQSGKSRNYLGAVLFIPGAGGLNAINIVDVEDYLPAVVRAEAGPSGTPEFYKAQTIIARTYCFRNIHKHSIDGYNLCDDVHCQVYHGISNDKMILEAVAETEGIVITDNRGNPIISAFHSNCGGETVRSDWAWVTGETYLLPVTDPWCTSSRNARWTKKIGLQDWKDYLYSKGLRADVMAPHDFVFRQPNRRENYQFAEFTLPLKQMRTDLGLKSAFFSVEVEGDAVTLNGKGYGHGVGLCQEGAIEMSRKGYTFDKILSFYYANVVLTHIDNAVLPLPVESQRQPR